MNEEPPGSLIRVIAKPEDREKLAQVMLPKPRRWDSNLSANAA